MSTRRQPNRAAEELISYFLSGESDQGLQSSWEPMAAVAQGGFGGSPDPDRRSYKHRLGPGRSAIGQARLVRRALAELPARQVEILFAAYGTVSWSGMIDARYGKGAHIRVTKRLGDLGAVALFTPAALANGKGKPGAYVIACCLDASSTGATRCKAILDQARGLLREAERAYLEARGLWRPQPVLLAQQAPMEAPHDFFA